MEQRSGKVIRSYVLFTNVDLTPTQRDQLRAAILDGIEDDRIQVGITGGADLAAMLNDAPHIRSAFFATAAFRNWSESWDAHWRVSAFAHVALVGRAALLDTLRGWIEDPAIRVIALSGSHMMGKTRVALEAVRNRDVSFVEALDRRKLQYQ